MPPKTELPVCAPNGFELLNGDDPNGFVLGLFVCPNTDGDPNELLEDCPKGLELLEPNMIVK